jgi:hypothetical protein
MAARPTTKLALAWAALVLLTLASWLMSIAGGHSVTINAGVTFGVLAAAFLKCRVIIRSFMEVRATPRYIRLFADTWLIGLTATAVCIYLFVTVH